MERVHSAQSESRLSKFLRTRLIVDHGYIIALVTNGELRVLRG